MPDLILFAASEKVIVDEAGGVMSVIALLERVDVPYLTISHLMLPGPLAVDWRIVTIWRKRDNDTNRNYQQRIEFCDPTGHRFFHSEVDLISRPDRSNYRIITNLESFPIAPDGIWSLKLLLRETNVSTEWEEKAEYPIVISYSQ